jgi:hypothetical protein
MSTCGIFKRLNASIDRWFTVPEVHAAGRIALYRVVFSAFYLWHLSSHFAANLAGLPDHHRRGVLLVEWIKTASLSPLFFELMESSLVTSLVILMVGYRVRQATATVLMLGCVYEAFYVSLSGEHSTILLTFYIPFFMMLTGQWGAAYSLDALMKRRAGRARPEPGDSSWYYFLPARAVLVVMAALFFSSAVLKSAFGATWLTPGLFANLALSKNITAAIYEIPLNPLAPTLAQMPQLADVVPYLVVLFEGTFFVALFNHKLRNFYLSFALIFHSLNALWFVVTFTPVLIAYGLFVDWQALRERLWPGRVALFDSIAPRPLIWATLILALATGILWNSTTGLRSAINLGGSLDWRTIWYPVLALSLVWWLRASTELVRALSNSLGLLIFHKRSFVQIPDRREWPLR